MDADAKLGEVLLCDMCVLNCTCCHAREDNSQAMVYLDEAPVKLYRKRATEPLANARMDQTCLIQHVFWPLVWRERLAPINFEFHVVVHELTDCTDSDWRTDQHTEELEWWPRIP